LDNVPEKRADPCSICGEDHYESYICGEDHTENRCPLDADYIADFNDAVYEYIKDEKAFARDRKREEDDLDALLKGIRNPNVDEV
jgi:hypothetical protein